MKTLELFDLPHTDARALLATGVPVYLTINPVEYHGPHLSLHNDRLLSRGLSQALAERLNRRHPDWPCVFASDIELGVEPCPGLGTRRLEHQTVRATILEACRALAELGARRVVLMTFHGAPLHGVAIHAGLELLRARGIPTIAPFHGVLRELIDLEDPWRYADALAFVPADVRAEVAAEPRACTSSCRAARCPRRIQPSPPRPAPPASSARPRWPASSTSPRSAPAGTT
jgi:creatinine amidohydrolase